MLISEKINIQGRWKEIWEGKLNVIKKEELWIWGGVLGGTIRRAALGGASFSIAAWRVVAHYLSWRPVARHPRLRRTAVTAHLQANQSATLTQLLLRELPPVTFSFPTHTHTNQYKHNNISPYRFPCVLHRTLLPIPYKQQYCIMGILKSPCCILWTLKL